MPGTAPTLPARLAPRHLQGKFVTFYGKNFTKEEMARNISDHIKRWQQAHPDWQQKQK